MELIKILTGADLLHVPIRAAASRSATWSATDPAVGRIARRYRAGSWQGQAARQNTSRRFRVFPDVPTVGEQVPGYEPPPAWSGYLGPAGMPPPIVRRLNEEINKAMASNEVRDKLELIGFVVLPPNTPEQFAASIKSELQSVGKIVKAAGIRPE
jgi:tripartite-type tricarboxylate transporter receptor subunit TctC